MQNPTQKMIIVGIICLLTLAACFSPWQGDTEQGTFSITINGGSDRRALYWDNSDDDYEISDLDHTITLTGGPGPDVLREGVKAGKTTHFTVTPGNWDITVKAYLRVGNNLVLKAEGSVLGWYIRPGRNDAIPISMHAPDGEILGGEKLPNTIVFLDDSKQITKTYGDPKFTNPINPEHDGSGVITYSSSDITVATVNSNTGEVTILKVGSTVIIANKAADDTYESTQVQYTLNVVKATLTVKADDQIIDSGADVPEYTYTISGYLKGDTKTVVSGKPELTCTYTAGSSNGSYPITIEPGTLGADNYDFNLVDGTVSVGLDNQRDLSIIDIPNTITYGDAAFTLSTSGGSGTGVVTYTIVSGNDVISISGNTVNINKAGTALIQAYKAGDGGYNPVNSETFTITVVKRDLSNTTVEVGGTHIYNGSPLRPTPTVIDMVGNTNIISVSDYTVIDYSNNINIGTAYVTITATPNGNYTGTQTGHFTIEIPINIRAIGGVTVPIIGGTPVTTITGTTQYTGTVMWTPNDSTFAFETVYTAIITLTAINGYTLQGVPENFFTVTGATTTNAADSGVVTAAFPATVYALGDTGPGGGKIFYYSEAGFDVDDGEGKVTVCHYLEAAPDDMPTVLTWASSEYSNINIPGMERGIGKGRENMALILATDAAAPAAKACKDYQGPNNLTDWFLPSQDELNELYKNRTSLGNIVETGSYWSSNQAISYDDYAWNQDFSSGRTYNTFKKYAYNVRAIRAF